MDQVQKPKVASNKQTTMESFVIKQFDDKTDQLLNHPLTLSITCKKSLFIIQKGTQQLKCGGLLNKLKKKFYSDYVTPARCWTLSNVDTGIRVHRQVYHLVHCKKYGYCKCEVKTNELHLNFMTTEAFRLMEEIEFTPIDSEVCIFSKTGHFGTKLDVIGYRWKGTDKQISTIISLKTGKSSSTNRFDGVHYLSKPYSNVKSTTRNHNQLQALSEVTILDKEYGLKFKSYFIFYLMHDGTSFYEQDDSWWGDLKVRDEFYELLCKRVQKPARKKRGKPKKEKETPKETEPKKRNEKQTILDETNK